jgi:hypothetical protein
METTKEILAILGKPISDTLPREQNPNYFSLEFLPRRTALMVDLRQAPAIAARSRRPEKPFGCFCERLQLEQKMPRCHGTDRQSDR